MPYLKKNNFIYLNFINFIFLILLSVLLPLSRFYVFIIFYFLFIIAHKISFRAFIKEQKIIFYIFVFNIPIFFYFYLDNFFFKSDISFYRQAETIINLSFRTAASILTINLYKKLNAFSDTLKILLKFKTPAKLVLVIIISVKLLSIFKIELKNFLRNYRLRIIEKNKTMYFYIMLKKIVIHFYLQTVSTRVS